MQAQERRENDWRCKSAGALAAGVCPGVGVLVLLVTNLLMAHQDSVTRQPETRRSERSHAHLLDESPVLPEDKSPIALVGFCSHTPQRYGHVPLPSPASISTLLLSAEKIETHQQDLSQLPVTSQM